MRTALREKRPVYLQLPSDISYLEIDAPAAPLAPSGYTGDARQIERVVELIVERIGKSKARAAGGCGCAPL
jgi:TPP-dependent 2-oxoacid decarboxylase